jgi:transposase
MALDPAQLPDDIAILKPMLVATTIGYDAEIASLKLTIAKLQRAEYGSSSERGAKLDQLELQLGELVEQAAQTQAASEIEAPQQADALTSPAPTLAPEKPARRPLPSHLPRERVVHPGACVCPDCGGASRKLGEDVTETLEVVPASWKVIQHVREKFSCRSCEHITQAPAPSHPMTLVGRRDATESEYSVCKNGFVGCAAHHVGVARVLSAAAKWAIWSAWALRNAGRSVTRLM